tara:strand:- start:179 stop:2599 length:2421 start_codon:yes stop_codon:yes gene_type:complete
MQLRTITSATILALGLPLACFAAEEEVNKRLNKLDSRVDQIEDQMSSLNKQMGTLIKMEDVPKKKVITSSMLNPNVYYGPNFSIGGFYQNQDNSFGELDTFIPVWQNATNVAFLNFRGLDRSGPSLEGNFGGGYRQLFSDEEWLWGAHGFYDLSNSQYNNTFQQVTLGGELKNETWAFLANGYIPVGQTSHNVASLSSTELRAGGDNGFSNLYFNNGVEQAMGGFDAEVGFSIPGLQDLTVYGGGYAFFAANTPSLGGPRSRITYDWWLPFGESKWASVFEKITFESAVQYDKQRGTQWYVGARLRVGIGSDIKDMTRMQRRMTDYVYRDADIVTGSKKNWQQATQDGKAITVAKVSTEDAFQSAIDNDATVIGVDGNINFSREHVLANGQTVTGDSFTYNGVETNIVNNGQLTQVATVAGVTGNEQGLLIVGQNNTVRDITLQGNDELNELNPFTSMVLRNFTHTDAFVGGGSVGTLTVNNVAFKQGGMALQVADASTNSHISVTNSAVTWDTDNAGAALGMGIYANEGSTVTVDNITNNTFNMSASTGGKGLVGMIFAANGGDDALTSTLNIGNIENNVLTIEAVSGLELVAGLGATAFGGENSSAVINVTGNISNNTMTFSGRGADGATGMLFSAAGPAVTGTASITIQGDITNNTIDMSSLTGQDIYGLWFDTQAGTAAATTTQIINQGTISGNTVSVPSPIIGPTSTTAALYVHGDSGDTGGGADLGALSSITLSNVKNNTFNGGVLVKAGYDYAVAKTTVSVSANEAGKTLVTSNNNAVLTTTCETGGTINIDGTQACTV